MALNHQTHAMNEDSELSVLREIRDQQRELLQLQREHYAVYRQHLDRAERINDVAERLQQRGLRAQTLIFFVVLPLLLLLIAFIAWPTLRHLIG
jgi:ABC-type uncharacterized transport system involved in gliding motility auxiliary subunit